MATLGTSSKVTATRSSGGFCAGAAVTATRISMHAYLIVSDYPFFYIGATAGGVRAGFLFM
jgi:hypothetical protein